MPNEIVINDPGSDTEYPDTLPLLTLSDQVVFPGSVVPIMVVNPSEIRLVNEAVTRDQLVAMVALKDPEEDISGLENAYEIGVIARILQVQHLPDGSFNAVLQSLTRFHIEGLVQREPYLVVECAPLASTPARKRTIAPLVTTIKIQMARLMELSPNIPEGAVSMIENIDDPGFLADLVGGNLSIPMQEKQRILATLDVKKRLERLMYLLAREIDLMEASNRIQSEVKSSIDKSQREYFLRAQLKAIKEELGESEEENAEMDEYRKKLEELKLPQEVEKEAFRELERLSHMSQSSAEYHVIATYLDWIVELPWHTFTEDQLDIDEAETILNADHYGLTKVKERILDYLAVRKLKPDAAGPILCFVGPPGVGKTSLGQSIARALGRKFTRMSLGGMRDEAEIRGHRKTYVGALPGRVIQSIRKVQSSNPVFMLDELDKLGSDFRGDPSSALLEVLDPAQNNAFHDLYLNVPYDLSKVMFIATANVTDTIPWALRDRMEIIEIPGYIVEEKLQIARRYLVPRQIDAHGIPKRKLSITVPSLRRIISGYTREAGVRNLEREIANVCRRAARAFAKGRRKAIKIMPDDLREYLGNERITQDTVNRTRIPGVATGLAWTATGGEILFVEATRMAGKGNLVLTGQLGDVMKESARAVLSFVRANADALGVDAEVFQNSDIHIHVPQGAVPKDGPSAGVTILTALTSVLINRPVKSRLAMTGEITLRGIVLPVGGVKEKVLAASRAGIKEIILPDRCKNDLDDVPETVRKQLKLHFVSEMAEVLAIALKLKLG